jgi:hypothetical protein
VRSKPICADDGTNELRENIKTVEFNRLIKGAVLLNAESNPLIAINRRT